MATRRPWWQEILKMIANGSHPIWKIMMAIAFPVVIFVGQWLTSTDWDANEIYALVGTTIGGGVLVGGGIGVAKMAKKFLT